jgi:hypothetical protein
LGGNFSKQAGYSLRCWQWRWNKRTTNIHLEQAMNQPYQYKIEQLDIAYGNMLVKYIPSDESLTALSFNIPILFEEDGLQKELTANIDKFAPQRQWAAQKFFIENGDSLVNLTGTVNP